MILEALFNGGIYASEDIVPKSDKFRQTATLISETMTYFEGKLSPEDYAMLEKLCDSYADEGNNGRFVDVRNLPQSILPTYRVRRKTWL